MNELFKNLDKSITEVMAIQENREKLLSEDDRLKTEARMLALEALEQYCNTEKQYKNLIAEAAREKDLNEKRIVQLMKKKIMEEGDAVLEAELKMLKGEVIAFPQTVEALEEIINEVKIPLSVVERFRLYESEWIQNRTEIKAVENELMAKLLQVQKGILPACNSSLEVVPGRIEFIPEDIAKQWRESRKEKKDEA